MDAIRTDIGLSEDVVGAAPRTSVRAVNALMRQRGSTLQGES
jgi:hypothetical protein